MIGLFSFMTIGVAVVRDLYRLLELKRGLTLRYVRWLVYWILTNYKTMAKPIQSVYSCIDCGSYCCLCMVRSYHPLYLYSLPVFLPPINTNRSYPTFTSTLSPFPTPGQEMHTCLPNFRKCWLGTQCMLIVSVCFLFNFLLCYYAQLFMIIITPSRRIQRKHHNQTPNL